MQIERTVSTTPVLDQSNQFDSWLDRSVGDAWTRHIESSVICGEHGALAAAQGYAAHVRSVDVLSMQP